MAANDVSEQEPGSERVGTTIGDRHAHPLKAQHRRSSAHQELMPPPTGVTDLERLGANAGADIAGLRQPRAGIVEIADALSEHIAAAPEPVVRMCVGLVGGALVELEKVRSDLEKWITVAEERSIALERADRATRAIRRAVELSASVVEGSLGRPRRAGSRPTEVGSSTVTGGLGGSPSIEVVGYRTGDSEGAAGSDAAGPADEIDDRYKVPTEVRSGAPAGAIGDAPATLDLDLGGVLAVRATTDSAPLARICVELAGAAIIESELLRCDLDKWQAVAEERARALDRVDAALVAVASAVESSTGIAQAAAGLALVAPRWRDVSRPAPGTDTRGTSDAPTAANATDPRSELARRARRRVDDSRASLAVGRRTKWSGAS